MQNAFLPSINISLNNIVISQLKGVQDKNSIMLKFIHSCTQANMLPNWCNKKNVIVFAG